ncbi:alpha/beta hydrolase family protein [Bacillus changyiensis]|uniref:alpha/beta hydrolase family protein n=1 Tax=Bacillus changyiensis TaxID=3004103 RepID=UPI0022E67EE9|nr:dienelactone hydrolase [Bacillus changyiensis]MDA1476927.1 dienelactone hydrolase [Bacillus changyiensis]
MRLFELLLLLSNIGLFGLTMIVKKGGHKVKLLLIASSLSTVLLTIHLITEGYRVQLIFLYCMSFFFLAISGYRYFKKNAYRKIPRFILGIIYTLMAIMLMISAVCLYAFPVFELPEPTGKYHVGTQTFHFVDKKREELFDQTSNRKRELMVQVWYPAKQPNGKPAPFIAEGSLLKEEPLSKTFGLPAITMDYLKYIPTHSYVSAKISTESRSYPLIILNHGYQSSKVYHTSQAENLASHGYIVASIDHTYSTFATVFPDGRTATMKTDINQIAETNYRDRVGKVWTDDITFIIDQFERINTGKIQTPFKGKLDLQHIGVLGHSFGGAASYDVASDSRITAGIDMDGGLYNYHRHPRMTKPFMFMFSDITFKRFNEVRQHHVYTDEEIKEMGASRAEIDKEKKDAELEIEHFKHVAHHGGHILYLKGLTHYNFADVQFLTPVLQHTGITGDIDPTRSTSIVNKYTLSFFNQYLKNKDDHLLDRAIDQYPEVKFVTPLFKK